MYLWNVFARLSVTRGSGFGINAITYQEIESYARMTGEPLRGWQVEVIARLDRMWMEREMSNG